MAQSAPITKQGQSQGSRARRWRLPLPDSPSHAIARRPRGCSSRLTATLTGPRGGCEMSAEPRRASATVRRRKESSARPTAGRVLLSGSSCQRRTPTASNRGCLNRNAVAPDRSVASLLQLPKQAPTEAEGVLFQLVRTGSELVGAKRFRTAGTERRSTAGTWRPCVFVISPQAVTGT